MSSKWVDLTNTLYTKTIEGSLNWSETSEDNVYQVVVGGIVIQFSYDGGFDDTYSIAIISKGVKKIDGFSNLDLNKFGDENWHELLEYMHQTIVRQLSGADKVIDDLLEALNNSKSANKSSLDDEIPF